MSGFDNIMRSQGMVAQHQVQQDQFRHQAMQGQAQAIGQFGDAMTDIVQFQQQLAIHKADAAMRLQEHQQQQQMNGMKFAAMAQIDMADMQRAEVQTAQANARMAQVSAELAERKAKEYSTNTASELESQFMRDIGGARGLYAMGRTYDEKLPVGRRIRAFEEGEQEAFGKRLDQAYEGAGNTGGGFNQQRNYLMGVIREARDQGDEDTASAAYQKLLQLDPTIGAAQAPKVPQPPQLSAQDQKVIGEIAAEAASRIRSTASFSAPPSIGADTTSLRGAAAPHTWAQESGLGSSEQDRQLREPQSMQKATTWAYQNRAYLLNLMNAGKAPDRQHAQFTEDDAVRWFMEALSTPSDPRHQAAVAFLRSEKVL
jgi:hypothetical protein